MDCVSFNASEEKRTLQNTIIRVAIDNGGIIYGSCIRDKFIIEHYSSIYNSVRRHPIEFWSKTVDPNTFGLRTMLHDKIEIMFPKKYNLKLFFKCLQDEYISNYLEDEEEFWIGSNLIKNEIYTLCTPIIRVSAKKIQVSSRVDIIISTELPEIDFDIEAFVYSKGGIGIRSSNTGVFSLDNMSSLDKIKLGPSIIKGIIDNKINVLRLNNESLKKIGYFIKQNYEIQNLPFITHGKYNSISCIVCLETNNTSVKLNNCYFCKDCMCIYFNTTCINEEYSERYIKDTNNSKIYIDWYYPMNT